MPKFFVNNWYDSIARYQTTSGVFSSPDPLAEKYYSLSPYAYCAGNPVKNIDERGDSLIVSNTGVIIETRGEDSGVYYYENGEYTYIGDLNGIIDIDYILSNLLMKDSFYSPECFFIILQIPITMAMNESIEEKRAKKMRVERVFH